MAGWPRDNPWRQGQVLKANTARQLQLAHADGQSTAIAVVISHDCDLAQPPGTEPHVEVIVGRAIDNPDGNCTHAKNSRKLHLPFCTPQGEEFVELVATAKMVILKEALLDAAPEADFTLTPDRCSILQRWLAARYRRAAFPDAFDERFDKTGLKERLTRILKTFGEHIPAVFFDVDDGNEVKRGAPDDTYTLDIYLLYSTGQDPVGAEAAALEAKAKIESACRDKLYTEGNGWQFIELRACVVVSDEAMTYQQSCILKKWSIDYISLRDEPQQPMLHE